jgi:hypothetical protein
MFYTLYFYVLVERNDLSAARLTVVIGRYSLLRPGMGIDPASEKTG